MYTELATKERATKDPDIVVSRQKGNRKHSTRGPSCESYRADGSMTFESYYREGIIHRLEGGALRCFTKEGSLEYEAYFINGVTRKDA